jgi:hypothetical protein
VISTISSISRTRRKSCTRDSGETYASREDLRLPKDDMRTSGSCTWQRRSRPLWNRSSKLRPRITSASYTRIQTNCFVHTPSFLGMTYTDDFVMLVITFISGRPKETQLASSVPAPESIRSHTVIDSAAPHQCLPFHPRLLSPTHGSQVTAPAQRRAGVHPHRLLASCPAVPVRRRLRSPFAPWRRAWSTEPACGDIVQVSQVIESSGT